jgi:hemolysin III
MEWLHVREPISAWTHFAWLVLAFPATWVLWRRSGGDWLKRVAMLVFGLGLVACYGGSWLFHSVPARLADLFNTVDHIGIHLLIAGTVTAVGLVILRGWMRAGLVAGIWVMAAAGISMRLSLHPSIGTVTGFYVVMGWVSCSTYFEMVRQLSPAKVRLVLIGGVLYTIGAAIHGMEDWLVIVPGVFGAHEIFHLFVMAGSAAHYLFMARAVVPYQRRKVVPLPV